MPWLSAAETFAHHDEVLEDDGRQALAELVAEVNRNRPAWQSDALCREYPDLPWFPELGETSTECKAVCRRCIVANECRAYVLASDISTGCWAGMSGRAIAKARRAAA